MNTVAIPTDKLTAANSGRWDNYARNMARMLFKRKIEMPVVVTPDYRVVNGIGRVQFYAEKKIHSISCVIISDKQAQFAAAMLNKLTMDFDIHTRYRDLLRYNSFRRSRRVRYELGRGFIFTVAPHVRSHDFDIRERANLQKWLRCHGRRIVDFGAGHLHETELLRQCGVKVTPFEPYRISGTDTIDKTESIRLTREFFRRISSGERYSSIFLSSVLNSVPFYEDRRHIACICGALFNEGTTLYVTASGTGSVINRVAKGETFYSERQSKGCVFGLDYETNITIGDFGEHPKVQKYHDPADFRELFGHYFNSVSSYKLMENCHAVCREVNMEAVLRDLAAALEFEFDLPYPDGSRMGLVLEAKAAFGKRLGVAL